MRGSNSIRKARLAKLKKLRELGMEPFPATVHRSHTVKEVFENFDTLAEKKTGVFLVGRIRSIREHGGSTFFHFKDKTGMLQGYVKKDTFGEKKYKIFLDLFDIGDIAEFAGTLFTTKKGEKTLLVSNFRMLAKSLLPLPEKWHGLQDVEERFRKRYLDLLMNAEVKEKFVLRSKIVRELRSFLQDEDFMEVETPVLQTIPGGARAKPFKTRLNALKLDLYLRIAPELYLKRLLVGGFENIFEIGRIFRNEGMDATHNPDFTMIELYAAYRDYEWMMAFVERALQNIVANIFGEAPVRYGEDTIEFGKRFRKIDFFSLVQKYTKIDIWSVKNVDLKKFLFVHKIKMNKETTRANMIDELYKEFCQKHLIQPTFVTNLPIELNPLAKENKDNPKVADRFQLVIGGIELINGFSELNNPIEQEQRFRQEIRDYGKDAKQIDYDFIEALEYGMPPAAGMGMGIDRLALLLTNSHSLREVMLFPTMKPKIAKPKRNKTQN